MNPKWRENELLESHVSSRVHANICGEISLFWGSFSSHTHIHALIILSIVEPLEEVGCQARGLKKQVVRPVRNSLQVREIVGEVISPGGSPTTATEL
jgi:hypothetical protein